MPPPAEVVAAAEAADSGGDAQAAYRLYCDAIEHLIREQKRQPRDATAGEMARLLDRAEQLKVELKKSGVNPKEVLQKTVNTSAEGTAKEPHPEVTEVTTKGKPTQGTAMPRDHGATTKGESPEDVMERRSPGANSKSQAEANTSGSASTTALSPGPGAPADDTLKTKEDQRTPMQAARNCEGTPEYVILRPGSDPRPAHSPARSAIFPGQKYGVLPTSPSTEYHLYNIADPDKRKIGSPMGPLRPKKTWFVVAPPPTPEELRGAPPNQSARPSDPYKLRNLNLPGASQVWQKNSGIDVYTGATQAQFSAWEWTVNTDHVLEVQTADAALEEVFPWAANGGRQEERGRTAALIVKPFLNGEQSLRSGGYNLNNTEESLNKWWKGVAVKKFHTEYRKRGGPPLGLAQLLRDIMREERADCNWRARFTGPPPAVATSKNQAPRYQPAWAGRVDTAMGKSASGLLDMLSEHDGEAAVQYGEALRKFAQAMQLNGFG